MRSNPRVAALVIALMILLCALGSAEAQSGRRAKERTSTPPVQPSAKTESTSPATDSEARRVSLIVTIDESLHSVSVPPGSSRVVLNGFVERLKKSPAFELKVEKHMSRKEAGDLAKSQTESFVVWLQLDSEYISSRSNGSDMYVEYVVLTPGTGKSKSQGRVYLRGYRRSVGVGGVPVGIPLPLPPTGPRAPLESTLQEAGRDAAERVMAALDVAAP
jgi:hypothetical protein